MNVNELIGSIFPKRNLKNPKDYLLVLGINAYEDLEKYMNSTKTITKGNYTCGDFNSTMYWRRVEVFLDVHSDNFYSIKLMKTFKEAQCP